MNGSRMDGQMDGFIDGKVVGWLDGLMVNVTAIQIYGKVMQRWIDRHTTSTNGWMVN